MPAWCSINQRTTRARRPAVVGRGLSEGLGLARVAAEVVSSSLGAAGLQIGWLAHGALASFDGRAAPGNVLSRGNASRL